MRKTCGAAMTCKHGTISRASSHILEHPWDVVRGIHIALEGGGRGGSHMHMYSMSRARAVRMGIMIFVVGFPLRLFRPSCAAARVEPW